jgi:hypothetical protein
MKQPASGNGRTSGLPVILKDEAGTVLGRPFGAPFRLGTALADGVLNLRLRR